MTVSEARHTPGEWKPGFKADSPDEDRHTVWQYVESPSGHSVATVGSYHRKRVELKSDSVKRISQEETDANVRLIAAAPDLLAELTRVEQIIAIFAAGNALKSEVEKLGGWDWERIHADLAKVIRKATGK